MLNQVFAFIRSGRARLAAVGAALFLIGAGCAYSVPREEDWTRVDIGMTKQDVVEVLGQPYMAQGSSLPNVNEDLLMYSDTTQYRPGERYAYYAIVIRENEVVEKHRYLTKLPPQEVLANVQQIRSRAREDALKHQRQTGAREPRAGADQPAGVGTPESRLPPERRPGVGAPLPSRIERDIDEDATTPPAEEIK
jgi:hypothetical protein